MRTYILRALVLAVTAALGGCSAYNSEGDWFFIRNGGADMPVWVKGNRASDTFVIWLHGGPGDGGMDFALVGWEALEKEHTVVYWEQRHAGISQGNADPRDTTVRSFVDDLELLLDVLESQYEMGRVVLYGTSWGATVGAAFLTLDEQWEQRQARVDGFIYAWGNHDVPLAYRLSRPKVIERLERGQLSPKTGADTASRCRAFYEERAEGLGEWTDWRTHVECVQAVKGYEAPEPDGQQPQPDILAAIFASPFSLMAKGTNLGATYGSDPFMRQLHSDQTLSRTMERVRVPTLVVAGRHDLIAPWEVGQGVYDTISSADRTLLLLEDTGHAGSFGGGDRALFDAGLLDFVNALPNRSLPAP